MVFWKWKFIRDQKVGYVCIFAVGNAQQMDCCSLCLLSIKLWYVSNFVVRRATWLGSLRVLSRRRPRVRSSCLNLFLVETDFCVQKNGWSDHYHNWVWVVCVCVCVCVCCFHTYSQYFVCLVKNIKIESKWCFCLICFNGIRECLNWKRKVVVQNWTGGLSMAGELDRQVLQPSWVQQQIYFQGNNNRHWASFETRIRSETI